MLALVSSSAHERSSFTSLCRSRDWSSSTGDSLRAARRLLQRNSLRALVVRHRLSDGFADSLLASLPSDRPHPRLILILEAGTPHAAESRLIALGADCVLRDPVRGEILAAWLEKYRRPPPPLSAPASQSLPFAGGSLRPPDRSFTRRDRVLPLTQREFALAELLAHSPGEVITYETLYSEILDRPFQGDTSNLRVLLGRLTTTISKTGANLRHWVEVIPKLGYRLHRSRRS